MDSDEQKALKKIKQYFRNKYSTYNDKISLYDVVGSEGDHNSRILTESVLKILFDTDL